MRDKLLKRLKKDVKKTSILAQSKIIKIPYATLNRIINGKSDGCIRTWEKIESHYNEQNKPLGTSVLG